MADDHDPQRRARQIGAFRDECEILAREGVFEPTAEQRAAIDRYHSTLLASLAETFDVDLTETQHSLSLGLRLASLVGAVALAAATILLVRRFWGWLALPAQISVAVIVPAVAFTALEWSARSPRRAHLTSLLTLVALAAVVANVEILGNAFTYAPSAIAILLYGLVGVGLAYAYDSRIALVVGACCLSVFVMSIPVSLLGGWWTDAVRRPESALVVGLACVVMSSLGTRAEVLAPWWRGTGSTLIGLALFMLSIDGSLTWLPSPGRRPVEVAYTISACLVGLTTIVVGARQRWTGISAGGAVLILAVLLAQYSRWWSHYIPQWLLFLAIGAAALGVGSLLARLRRSGRPS